MVLMPPNVLGIAVAHVKSSYMVPVPVNCNEFPTAVVVGSDTPMSVLVNPFAAPPTAIKEPS